MADWTPIPGANTRQRGQREHDSVRIYVSGQIAMSSDVAERFGDNGYVLPLRNGRRDVIGLRATKRQPGTSMVKISTPSGGTRMISARNILNTAQKCAPESTVALPHHWDGDILVIDLSGLPDAPGRL